MLQTLSSLLTLNSGVYPLHTRTPLAKLSLLKFFTFNHHPKAETQHLPLWTKSILMGLNILYLPVRAAPSLCLTALQFLFTLSLSKSLPRMTRVHSHSTCVPILPSFHVLLVPQNENTVILEVLLWLLFLSQLQLDNFPKFKLLFMGGVNIYNPMLSCYQLTEDIVRLDGNFPKILVGEHLQFNTFTLSIKGRSGSS